MPLRNYQPEFVPDRGTWMIKELPKSSSVSYPDTDTAYEGETSKMDTGDEPR